MSESFSFKPKKSAMQLALDAEEARKREAAAIQRVNDPEFDLTPEQKERRQKGYVDPERAADRIAILFDDSGSMGSGYPVSKIKDAQDGCIEFMKNCQVNMVACGVFPMNAPEIPYDTNLPKIAALIPLITNTGGTPMYETWYKIQISECDFTRVIIFSDGEPTDRGTGYGINATNHVARIQQSIEVKVPVDTVFIAAPGALDSDVLKDIASKTGGIYLKFERGKVNFKQAFKYLSPGMRLMLMDPDFKADVEAGRK